MKSPARRPVDDRARLVGHLVVGHLVVGHLVVGGDGGVGAVGVVVAVIAACGEREASVPATAIEPNERVSERVRMMSSG
ncbi:MAG: hypothetical protein R2697_13060 [Ilumatobacteraceae bacterium]